MSQQESLFAIQDLLQQPDLAQRLAAAKLLDPRLRDVDESLLRNAESVGFRFLNEDQYVPEKEGNINHRNEADVVRTASLYLIHPVMQALWAHPLFDKAISSQAEDTKNNTRTDITLYKSDQGGGQNIVPFAVIEFKRRTIISGNDFRHWQGKYPAKIKLPVQGARSRNHDEFCSAMSIPHVPLATNANAYNMWSAANTELNAVVTDPVNKVALDEHLVNNQVVQSTLFPNGPRRLIQQAASYAIEHRTRYVALFDYDYLVLCHFLWLDTTQSAGDLRASNHNASNRYPVEVDIYPFTATNTSPSEAHLMRRALLGFLWHALMEKNN